MKHHSMRSLPMALAAMAAVAFSSCSGCSSRGVGHYDTTQVDTMMAVNLDSAPSDEGAYVSSWSYQNDSAVATIQSAPNKNSQITASNRMTIRIRYLGRVGIEACMILGDGEQFSGNSYDSTNFVRIYARGDEVGRFTYKPGISKQTDSAFIQNPVAFVDCLRKNRSLKIETTTFTSGSLVYSFDAISGLADRRRK
ncbi:hypothetical protein [Prevotella denticola]|uniref:hypothetical protein n=1 Tax=Prevotella denticola TaxID=28129 RepID=UPI001CABBF32|nr:hypothetical protein [Prevotella denticola]MBF1387894.1 hypothetical protein [Prevotella denticola]